MMLKHIHCALALSLPGLLLPKVAVAAPGDTAVLTGTTRATVVAPASIEQLDNLRFGQIFRPVAAGFITIAPNGTLTTTGGMTGLTGAAQTETGQGPARFRINGDPNRTFRIALPSFINIVNGTASMRVNQFRDNVPAPRGALDSAGQFSLLIGARLSVNANQATGDYSGTYTVTVTYD